MPYFSQKRPYRFAESSSRTFDLKPPTSLGEVVDLRQFGRNSVRGPEIYSTVPRFARSIPDYSRTIDLSPSDFHRIHPGSEDFQAYSRMSRSIKLGMKLKYFKLGGALGAAGFAFDLFDQLNQYDWQVTRGELAAKSYNFAESGWTTFCNRDHAIPPRPFSKMGQFVTTGVACPGSEVGTGGQALGTAIAVTTLRVQLNESTADVPNTNGRVWQGWNRVPSTLPAPQYFPNGRPAVVMPVPSAVPAPSEEIETGGQDKVRYRLGPGEQVGITFRIPVKGPPTKGGEPYRDDVPPPRNREKKWRLGKGGPVGDAFGAVTELLDAMDCAVHAIKTTLKEPQSAGHKRYLGAPRGKTKGFWNQKKYITENFDVANPAMVKEFLSCMVKNEITDRIYGKLSSKAGKAFGQATGSPRGPGIKRPPPVPSGLSGGHSWF